MLKQKFEVEIYSKHLEIGEQPFKILIQDSFPQEIEIISVKEIK